MPRLDTPVQFVKGIGPRIADLLAAKGRYSALYHSQFAGRAAVPAAATL